MPEITESMVDAWAGYTQFAGREFFRSSAAVMSDYVMAYGMALLATEHTKPKNMILENQHMIDLKEGVLYKLVRLHPADHYRDRGLVGETFIFDLRTSDAIFKDYAPDSTFYFMNDFDVEVVSDPFGHYPSTYTCPEDVKTEKKKEVDHVPALRQALQDCIKELERRVKKDYKSEPDKYKYLLDALNVLENSKPKSLWGEIQYARPNPRLVQVDSGYFNFVGVSSFPRDYS